LHVRSFLVSLSVYRFIGSQITSVQYNLNSNKKSANPLSNQTSRDTDRATPIWLQNKLWESVYIDTRNTKITTS